MKIKVSEAEGIALDWLVAKAKGLPVVRDPMGFKSGSEAGYWIWEEKRNGLQTRIGGSPGSLGGGYNPSTNPAQGQPIQEEARIWLRTTDEGGDDPSCLWRAELPYRAVEVGPTAMIAGMRCFVSSELGEVVEIPDALAPNTQLTQKSRVLGIPLA